MVRKIMFQTMVVSIVIVLCTAKWRVSVRCLNLNSRYRWGYGVFLRLCRQHPWAYVNQKLKKKKGPLDGNKEEIIITSIQSQSIPPFPPLYWKLVLRKENKKVSCYWEAFLFNEEILKSASRVATIEYS